MKTLITLGILIVLGVLLTPRLEFITTPETAVAYRFESVKRGDLSVWSNYRGEVNSSNVFTIMSKLSRGSVVVDMVGDATRVEPGQMLVRFESSELEQKIIKLERELTLSQTELESLKFAKAPMEMAKMKGDLQKLRGQLKYENAYLKDSLALYEEKLVSLQEIEKQKSKVAQLKTDARDVENNLGLTRDYLHPLALKHAQSKVGAAEQELKIARQELQQSIIASPEKGQVVYKPLHIGTEFRTIRIGDTLYPNQPFMVLPDMDSLQVIIYVPEAELAKVSIGRSVQINPIAYADISLPGRVEKISGAASTRPGRPQWQRFFAVTINVLSANQKLKSGMSVLVHIKSFQRDDVLRISRRAVQWNDNKPYVDIEQADGIQTRGITVGIATEEYYEITSGLEPGDKVLIQ